MKKSGQRCFINPLPLKIRYCIYSEQWGDVKPMQNPTGMWMAPVRWGDSLVGGSLPAQLCWRLLRCRGWAGVLVLQVVAKYLHQVKIWDDLWVNHACISETVLELGLGINFPLGRDWQSTETSFPSPPVQRAWSQLWLPANVSANVFLLS